MGARRLPFCSVALSSLRDVVKVSLELHLLKGEADALARGHGDAGSAVGEGAIGVQRLHAPAAAVGWRVNAAQRRVWGGKGRAAVR